jgi:hypothetical protein
MERATYDVFAETDTTGVGTHGNTEPGNGER